MIRHLDLNAFVIFLIEKYQLLMDTVVFRTVPSKTDPWSVII